MASERFRRRLWCRLACAAALVSCAEDPRRFALSPPVLRDQDLDLVKIDCRETAKKAGADAEVKACMPEPYESSFAWDAADHVIFRPISKFFQVDSYGEAENVNAFDEVPDSSWFTNRIGSQSMSPEAVASGYCSEGPQLKPDEAADASWLIDHGKDNGANPGFRIKVDGTKFMVKTDDAQAERTTSAAAVASRLYYAAGWWAPCDSVIYFKKSVLKLKPGLTVKANVGPVRKFDDKRLSEILAAGGKRGDLYRAVASRWLPGEPLGPFTYEGTRDDDPSDTIAHENRRDLRGARVMAAWLNHFDSREQNSMSTWMAANPKDPRSAGYVRHWYIDLGDCFGSEWSEDGFSRRLGHSYLLDFNYILEDFITLGVQERPWDRAYRSPGATNFGYFSERDFDPDLWRGLYPNPAFSRMTERDAAWATRIISRFTAEDVRAAVNVANLTKPEHTEYLYRVLRDRQHTILKRYFSKLSPLADVRVLGRHLCARDLARKTGTFPREAFHYAADLARGKADPVPARSVLVENDDVCLDVPQATLAASLPDNAVQRYVTVRMTNGIAPGPLEVHFFDLGPERGLRLVGIERPGS